MCLDVINQAWTALYGKINKCIVTSFTPSALALGLEKLGLVPWLSMAVQEPGIHSSCLRAHPTDVYMHADEVCVAQKKYLKRLNTVTSRYWSTSYPTV